MSQLRERWLAGLLPIDTICSANVANIVAGRGHDAEVGAGVVTPELALLPLLADLATTLGATEGDSPHVGTGAIP